MQTIRQALVQVLNEAFAAHYAAAEQFDEADAFRENMALTLYQGDLALEVAGIRANAAEARRDGLAHAVVAAILARFEHELSARDAWPDDPRPGDEYAVHLTLAGNYGGYQISGSDLSAAHRLLHELCPPDVWNIRDWEHEVEDELVRQMCDHMLDAPVWPRSGHAVTHALAAWICRKQYGAPMGYAAIKLVQVRQQPVAA